MPKVALILFWFIWFVGLSVKQGFATLESCSATVTPNSVATSTTQNFNFTLNNTGSNSVLYFKVSVPSSNFTIVGGSVAGWTAERSSSTAEFYGGSLAAGATLNFTLHAQSGTQEATSSDWGVAANDVLSGSGTTACSGSLGTTISGVTDVTAPVLSDTITLSDVTDSSVKVNWTTNEVTNSTVYYGTTQDYGSTSTGSSGVTAHSVTLSGLTANTTYYFYVQSADPSGNSTISDAGTFVTAAAGLTGASTTVTVTNTVTTTKTETATVTKTVILADTAKPAVSVTTKLVKTYAEAPILEGKVSDTGAVNVGVAKIQYSTDNGVSWLLVDEPAGARTVEFSFVPEVFEDGNYNILVRATDQSGNVGVSVAQTLVIDRLPPRIIHSLWRVGPIILSAPYQLVANVPVQITLQAVGGVTEMELRIANDKFALIKNFETGLWEGEITTDLIGNNPVTARAIDGGGNEIVQEIGQIKVEDIPDSTVESDVTTTVYRLDDLTKRYKAWNGEVYGQDNPSINKSSWYLPPGKYYIEAKGRGYKTAQSEIFTLDDSGVVAITLQLGKWSLWGFWSPTNLIYSLPTIETDKNKIDGNQILWLDKTIYRGKEIRLVVLPLWEPRLAGILANLNEGDVVVFPGANKSSVDLLKIRGSYKMELVADPDGEILSDLKGVSLPANYMINRRGQIE